MLMTVRTMKYVVGLTKSTFNFIIDDTLDEVGKMVDIGKNVNEGLSQYRLIINPTMNCNFRCWYCYETHLPNTKMTNEMIERVRKLISLI